MITQGEVLAEKDRILVQSLYSLADSELAESMILQGGGALHFIYSSPRYSDDVDFVDTTILDGVDAYANRLHQVGTAYPVNKIKVMSSGMGVRAKWGHSETSPLAKIEVEARHAADSSRSKGKFPLLIKSPADIYADKIFANISRYNSRKDSGQFPFKPTDLFDLDYLVNAINCQPVSREAVLEKARAYGEEHLVTPANIKEMVALITDESRHDFFRDCLRRTMMPDVYGLFNFNATYFKKAAEHFERYK